MQHRRSMGASEKCIHNTQNNIPTHIVLLSTYHIQAHLTKHYTSSITTQHQTLHQFNHHTDKHPSWGHDKETLLLTYNALGKSIATPVWSTNASDSRQQECGFKDSGRAHKMASIDHLHQESLTLRVKDYSDMLSAQYLVNCLEEDHVSQELRPRPMKETLHSRHHSTVLPRLGLSRMESHQNLHIHAVGSAIQLQGNNRVRKKRPPQYRTRSRDSTEDNDALSHNYGQDTCNLLQDYMHRVLGEPSDICTDCGTSPQDVRHLFVYTTHPTDLSPEDLWQNQVGSIRGFSYLDNGNLD